MSKSSSKAVRPWERPGEQPWKVHKGGLFLRQQNRPPGPRGLLPWPIIGSWHCKSIISVSFVARARACAELPQTKPPRQWEGMSCISLFFFLKKFYFFIWLHWVLEGIWDFNFSTRGPTHILCFGRWILNHWSTREVPGNNLYQIPWLSHWTNGFCQLILWYQGVDDTQ